MLKNKIFKKTLWAQLETRGWAIYFQNFKIQISYE